MSSLAAVQADGYYHPPDYDPEKHGSLNKYRGSHGALGARARKLSEGILVVRFEMPYPVWCGQCGHLMDTGVRFNAEKRHVGMYHSTKVWSFTMRTPCCKNVLEMRTDPANAAYVVVRGGRKKVLETAAEDGLIGTDSGRIAVDPRASDRPNDAIALVEKEESDRRAALEHRAEVASLREASERRWGNDVQANRMLREAMRAARRDEKSREKRRTTLGLPDNIQLAPETEMDRMRAAAVHFGSKGDKHRHNWRHDRRKIIGSSIFSTGAVAAAARNSGQVITASVPTQGQTCQRRDKRKSSQTKSTTQPNLGVKVKRLDSRVKLRLNDTQR